MNGVPKQSYILSDKMQGKGKTTNKSMISYIYENVSYANLLFCKSINNFTSDFVSGNFDGLDMSKT